MVATTHLKTIGFAMVFLAFLPFTPARAQPSVTPADARAIAEEATIYGFPMVES